MSETILENARFFSDKISTQLRTISIGILSIAWLSISGNKEIPEKLRTLYQPSFWGIANLVILALFLDILHYIFGYLNSKNAIKNGYFDIESRIAKTQNILFWLKILPIAISCIWLTTILAFGLA